MNTSKAKLYYPDIKTDPSFLEKLKYHPILKNFKYTSVNQNLEEIFKGNQSNSNVMREFIKTPSQQFVSNYISPNTPYMGILLVHGVGAGKTCAGISIAESFRKVFSRPALIVVPSSSLQETWNNEIFNFDKESAKNEYNNHHDTKIYNVQCTGDAYLPQETIENPKKRKKWIQNKIKENYEFKTYGTILNEYNKKRKQLKDDEDKLDKWIYTEYSNRVLIFDEIHRVHPDVGKELKLMDTESTHDSDTKMQEKWNLIKKIAKKTDHSYMVLLTATPMYNDSRQIVDIVNLILQKSRLKTLKATDFFPSTKLPYHSFKRGMRDTFIEKIKGLISYVKGENPETFPMRLYPKKDWLSATLQQGTREINSMYNLSNNELLVDRDLNFNEYLTLYYSAIRRNSPQHRFYLDVFNRLKSVETFLVNSNLMLATLISVPEIADSDSDSDSEDSLPTNIRVSSMFNSYMKYCEEKKDPSLLDFLEIDALENYSSKLFSILKCVQRCLHGSVFIYSNLKELGANLIALVLEMNGYQQFHLDGSKKKSIFDKMKIPFMNQHKKHHKDAPKYILLTGDTHNIDDLIKEARGQGTSKKSNLQGEHIKVVIGSKVLREGFSLFGTRQIHILEPWYHLNSLEQSIGRGVRNFSHIRLDPPDRNVMIFLHCVTMPLINNEKELQQDYNKIKINLEEEEDEDSESEQDNDISFDMVISDYHDIRRLKPDSGISFMNTPDQKLYKLSYTRHREIAYVSRMIQQAAVDCPNNKAANQFSKKRVGELSKLQLKTFEGLEISDVFGHNDNSLECMFDTCDYECEADKSKRSVDLENYYHDISWSGDQYQRHPLFESIKNEIRNLFKSKWVWSGKDIVSILGHHPKYVVNGALDHIIKNNQVVYDSLGRKGYVIFRNIAGNTNGFYIYQPIWDSIQPDPVNNLTRQPEYLPYSIRNQFIPKRLAFSILDKQAMVLDRDSQVDVGIDVGIDDDILETIHVVTANIKKLFDEAKKLNQGGTPMYDVIKRHYTMDSGKINTIQDIGNPSFESESSSIVIRLPSIEEYLLMVSFIVFDTLPIHKIIALWRYLFENFEFNYRKLQDTNYVGIVSEFYQFIHTSSEIKLENNPIWMVLCLYIFESDKPLTEDLDRQEEYSLSIVGNKDMTHRLLRIVYHDKKTTHYIGDKSVDSSPEIQAAQIKTSFTIQKKSKTPFSFGLSYLPSASLDIITYMDIKEKVRTYNYDNMNTTQYKRVISNILNGFKLKKEAFKSVGGVILTKEPDSLNEDYNEMIVANYNGSLEKNIFVRDRTGNKRDKVMFFFIMSQFLRFTYRFIWNTDRDVIQDKIDHLSSYYIRPYEKFIKNT